MWGQEDAAVVEPHGCGEGVRCMPALGRNLPNKRHKKKGELQNQRFLLLAAIL